jgi:hypothetical protein
VSTHDSIETRLLRRSWDDGLVDLFSGVALLLIGLSWQFDLVALGAIGPALLVTVWSPVRQRLIEPRAGFAEPGPSTRRRLGRGQLLLVLTGTCTFLLGIATFVLMRDGAEFSAARLVPGLPAALLGFGAALAAGAFAMHRFFAYAALLVAAGAMTILLDLHPAPSILASGIVVTLCGTLLLARFLHDNPSAGEHAA